MKVDLAQLRRAIDAAPADGMMFLPVDKPFLEQLHRELSDARAADRQVAMNGAIEGLAAERKARS